MDDKTLRQNVIDELDWDPSVDSAEIGVLADAGVVTLNGHVCSFPQKYRAAEIARRVRGVKAVVQEIEVLLPFAKDKDEDVAHRAVQVLRWNVTVPTDAVKVQVNDGFVTLTGQVDWQYQRRAAEQAIRRLSGVTGVLNSITLRTRVSPGDVRKQIVSALHRNADLEAQGIVVDVVDGKVTLKGKVRAWYERDLLENAAWAAPGVQSVDDHVTLS